MTDMVRRRVEDVQTKCQAFWWLITHPLVGFVALLMGLLNFVLVLLEIKGAL